MKKNNMFIQPIIPAIIPETYEHIAVRLNQLHSIVKRVQIDVMDGTYTHHKSWPYIGMDSESFFAKEKQDESLPFHELYDFEIDMLLKHPEKHIRSWALSGATSLIVHIETVENPQEIIDLSLLYRIELGVALKPSTPIEKLAPYIPHCTFVQCMGNDTLGRHGMRLSESVCDKIISIKKEWEDVLIGVDIGVNEETLPSLVRAGADRFAVGSGVFGESGDAVSSILLLEKLNRMTQEEVKKAFL
jgi:ribulose-phosphate 3-epimerase